MYDGAKNMTERKMIQDMALRLTPYEQDMLDGKYGEAKQLAMKIMMKIGEPLGAEELVEIVSVQAMAHFGSLHIAGRDYLGKLACMGGKCCVPTTQDPASIPFDTWEEMGYDKEYAENQMKLCKSIMALGEYHAWSCTPYVQGSVPRVGQNVAWAESSAVSYANSVLGARTNRTPAGLAICAALTGRIPKFGLYLDENRRAQIKFVVDAGELSDLDYNTIGIIIGKRAKTYVPAIYGIPVNCTNDNLKYLGACAAASGSVGLWHAVGVTPEALHGDPFEGREPIETITITREMLTETEKSLCTKDPGEPDLYVTGCPHSSVHEITKIASLMEGRKVKEGKDMWIFTTAEAANMLRRSGVVQKLEAAGVRMMVQTCLVISPLVHKEKYKTLITDSGKDASYLPSEHHIELIYASMENCIEAVTEKA